MLHMKSVKGYTWATFSWHGLEPMNHLEGEANANKHKAVTSDHHDCMRIDEPESRILC